MSALCEYASERPKKTEKKASMVSNVSVIRSEAKDHYETPLRLYLQWPKEGKREEISKLV